MKTTISPADSTGKSSGSDEASSVETAGLFLELCERKVRDGSIEDRVESANDLGAAFTSGNFTNALERDRAEAILEKLCQDETLAVRQAICDQLLGCPIVPSNIARILANDVESISVPFVRCSKVLTDADLIDLVRDGHALKQVSVARREVVSQAVTQELLATAKKTVVKTVLANHGAEISEESFHGIVDDFGDLSSVQSLFIERQELPISVTEKLATLDSTPIAQRPWARHQVPQSLVSGLSGKAKNSAHPDWVDMSDRTSPSMTPKPIAMLRMFSSGDFYMFNLQMASMAGISPSSAEELIIDSGPNGFCSLYEQAGLPARLFNAFRIARDVYLEFKREGKDAWSDSETEDLINRLGRAYEDVKAESLNSILEQLGSETVSN